MRKGSHVSRQHPQQPYPHPPPPPPSTAQPNIHGEPVSHPFFVTVLRGAEVFLIAGAIELGIFGYASWKTGSFLLAWPYLQGHRLVISPRLLDLGVLPRQTVVDSSVEITNLGSSVITLVGAQPSCGCLTPAAFPIKIEPGQSHTLTLKLATPKEAGVIEHSLKVFSDCPRHVTNQITVSGIVE